MIEITHEPLDAEAVTWKVLHDAAGAVVTFLGVTRDHTGDRKVLFLEYEAYRPMADQQLARVAEEMMERWDLKGVAIAHRLGRLENRLRGTPERAGDGRRLRPATDQSESLCGEHDPVFRVPLHGGEPEHGDRAEIRDHQCDLDSRASGLALGRCFAEETEPFGPDTIFHQ